MLQYQHQGWWIDSRRCRIGAISLEIFEFFIFSPLPNIGFLLPEQTDGTYLLVKKEQVNPLLILHTSYHTQQSFALWERLPIQCTIMKHKYITLMLYLWCLKSSLLDILNCLILSQEGPSHYFMSYPCRRPKDIDVLLVSLTGFKVTQGLTESISK